jgi:hypothetical protein
MQHPRDAFYDDAHTPVSRGRHRVHTRVMALVVMSRLLIVSLLAAAALSLRLGATRTSSEAALSRRED